MKAKVYIRSFFNLLDFIPRCLLCQRDGHRQLPLCESCFSDLPWLTSACPRCAEPLNPQIPAGQPCGHCLHHPPRVSRTLSAMRYEYPINRLVHRLKEDAELPAIKLAARLFSERFADTIAEQPPQLLLPVPLHRRRLFERGYNQAAELAWRIGNQLALEVRTDLLKRHQPTPHQQGLCAKQRRRNLRQAFSSNPLPDGITHVALIDDVITTGSTLDAIARALQRQRSGRQRLTVEAWSVARTPKPGPHP